MIIAVLVVLRGHFHGQDQLYAYAIGVLAGTVVQLAMAVYALRLIDFRFAFAFDWRDERVVRVLKLMVPVCLGLGIINFDLLINSSLGTLVSSEAPRAIDAAFRVYMLPQGMFSVAVATVLFPALSAFAARRDYDGLRATMSTGLRQINLLLVPAAAFILVLSTPIVRLIFQHGSFHAVDTQRVSTALFWFAFSLPFSGPEPPPHADVLLPPEDVDADQAGGGQHGRRRHRLARSLQAVRHRRPRHRDRRRLGPDDRPPGRLPPS